MEGKKGNGRGGRDPTCKRGKVRGERKERERKVRDPKGWLSPLSSKS